MAFDGMAVSVIAQELNTKLLNARVIKIYQIDKHTIIFQLRGLGETNQLLISTAPTYPRIHTTKANYENPVTPPAFCMLLRKYLEPSRILQIKQHELERIITIDLEGYDQNSGQSKMTLIFELMGRHSNLTLVDKNNMILDSINRMTENINIRPVLPGISYQFPPDQGKENPHSVSKDKFIDSVRLLPANTKLFRGLIQLYQGFGPETAQEIVRRAQLDPEQLKQDTDLAAISQLWYGMLDFLQQPGSPVFVADQQKSDFYAYNLTGIANQKEFPDLDSLLDTFYTTRITREMIQQKTTTLRRALNTHLKRIVRREKIQRQALNSASDAEKWKKIGELITANIHNIKKGDTSLEVIDYYLAEQPRIEIQLESNLSPSENAQLFFKRYRKAKTSQKITTRRLEKSTQERMYIEDILLHIELADSLETLDEIESELIAEGYIKAKKSNKQERQRKAGLNYDRYVSSDGIDILVGRNNQQNDSLTFRVARPDELWLHAQKIPGSHVIIRQPNIISEQTLLEAATLAAYYSKARTSSKVPVDYTQRKHVRKPNGAKPGFVIYENFKTILVDPTSNKDLPIKKEI